MLPFRFGDLFKKRTQRRLGRRRSALRTADAAAAIEVLEDRALLAANLTVDLDASKDNTLYEDPAGAISNGAGAHFFAGANQALNNGNSTQNIRRGLIAFDIAAANIPAGSTITDAVLTLHMSRTNANAPATGVSVHTVTTDWGEAGSDADGNEGGGAVAQANDATWLDSFLGTSQWSTAGGDFNSSPSATTVVDTVGFYSWTGAGLVNDVQDWFDGVADNFGWALLGLETNQTAKRFDSRNNGDESVQPVLSITYDEPILPGLIQGQKWHDLNANGKFEAGEPALDGWTIEIAECRRVRGRDCSDGNHRLQRRRTDRRQRTWSLHVRRLAGRIHRSRSAANRLEQAAPEYFSDLRPENVVADDQVTSEGAGAIWYVLDEDANQLYYNISTDELDGSITAIFLERATPGQLGDALHQLSAALEPSS